jgi:hypothetical protein
MGAMAACRHVAAVDNMLIRQQFSLLQSLLNIGQRFTIRCRCDIRLDIRNQLRAVGIDCFSQRSDKPSANWKMVIIASLPGDSAGHAAAGRRWEKVSS